MQPKQDNWVLAIEQDLNNHRHTKLIWCVVFLMNIIVFYLSKEIPYFRGTAEYIEIIFLIVLFVAIAKVSESHKNPDYLAFYLYKIGYELPDFELEKRYLKGFQKYIKKCNKQILYLYEASQQTEYFVDDVLGFLSTLWDIIMRLNYTYSKEANDETLMDKLCGTSSDIEITKHEFISLNLIELANLIHKEHSILTENHDRLAKIISNEMEDIPIKPFKKDIPGHFKKRWNILPYTSKVLLFSLTLFGIMFVFLSQILMFYGHEQPYSEAILKSVVITAAVFTQIGRFIPSKE